jgi:hypothetical protein
MLQGRIQQERMGEKEDSPQIRSIPLGHEDGKHKKSCMTMLLPWWEGSIVGDRVFADQSLGFDKMFDKARGSGPKRV